MKQYDFKHIRFNCREGLDVRDPQQTNQLSGGLRSLIAMYPEKKTHLVTTLFGVYRCQWSEEGHWDVDCIINAQPAEVSDTYV